MKKLFICFLCMLFSLNMLYPMNEVNAMDSLSENEGEIVIDLTNVKVGDTIIIFENEETLSKFVIDILPANMSRLTSGTGAWSEGSIPQSVVTMYPHYVDNNYDYSEMGYYVVYDGAKRKIIDVYGETLGVLEGEITQPIAKITSATATTSTYARSQMTWVYESTAGSSLSCYLIQEINYNNQMRLRWRF